MVKGEGENILILAGWGTDYKVYKNLAESISNYAKVFYFDMPGFGKSDEPKEPWNVDNYISLVEEFIRQMNIKELSIIGHSNGGRICIKMLADNNLEFKVKKLIKLELEILFYSVSFYIINLIINMNKLNNMDLLKITINSVFPVFRGLYWFPTIYIGLYLLSPFINKLIKRMERKNY